MPLSCSNKLVDMITKFQTYETSGVYYVLTKCTLANDIVQIVLLAKKLSSISRSGGDHGGRGGGRGGGGHEDHVGMEKKKNARDRKDVEWFVDGSGTILRITAILFN